MKKSEFIIIAAVAAFLFMAGCVGTQKAIQEAQITETKEKSQDTEEKPLDTEEKPQDTEEEPQFVFTGQIPETLAIFPFENNSITSRDRFEALSRGVSAMLGAFLKKSGATFRIVERGNIRFLVDECEISQSETADKSTANKLGRILGAQAIAFGSFIVFEDKIHITVRIIRVETGELIMAETVMGNINHFTDAVHKLARKIAYSFKAGEQQDVALAGSDIDAALFFSKGLDALDQGRKPEAERLFAKSIELDPAYQEQVDNVKGFNPGPAQSSGQTKKILLIISEDNAEQSFETESVETLLARYLHACNYQVVTSDKLAPCSNLSKEDILDAKKRDIKKARKAAVFNGANLILTGPVKTRITPEELHGVKMNKAVAIISYKVLDTASGNELDMDSRKYLSIGRTREEAEHSSFKYMARDIAQITARKIPSGVSVHEKKMLSAYKEELMADEQKLTVRTEKKNEKPAEPAMKPKAKRPGKSGSPQITKKPGSGSPQVIIKKPGKSGSPQIIIINPPADRGFKVIEKKSRITIEGLAIDASGIRFVKINDQAADTDAKGYFSHYITLAPGDNHFRVVAMNKLGKTAAKKLLIRHPEDKTPPEIVLISPRIHRGFKAVVRKPEKPFQTVSLQVKGVARDDSGVLYVRINDKDAIVNKQGNFSRVIALNSDNKKIVIEAADTVGNRARKEFSVDRKEQPEAHGIKPALWGLAIGVSQYGSTTADLRYADKDALSLARFLAKQEGRLFSEVRFKTLVNNRVTRASIIENISTHLGKAAPDDVVFIFLAGHGIRHRQSGSYYFVPYDADSESILSKGLRISDFEEAISILSKNVNKVIIAMDTCHSGAVQVGLRSGTPGENLAEALKQARGRFILAAAKSGEISVEDEKFRLDNGHGHGAFTYALIRGMMGEANYDNDNYISLNELFQYVAKQVPRLTDGRQHPYLRSEGTDMPFILVSE